MAGKVRCSLIHGGGGGLTIATRVIGQISVTRREPFQLKRSNSNRSETNCDKEWRKKTWKKRDTRSSVSVSQSVSQAGWLAGWLALIVCRSLNDARLVRKKGKIRKKGKAIKCEASMTVGDCLFALPRLFIFVVSLTPQIASCQCNLILSSKFHFTPKTS